MHFFVISTSKTAPNPSVFNTFYFQMCFAPQRHALFQHLNFQKWSGAEVFCTFSLRNRLRATTACSFSSLISPDVSAPAALASLLVDPPEPQNHEKTQCFATFLPFRAPASSFFWSFLFWLFSLLTAFSSLHIVGSLTSKFPSIIYPDNNNNNGSRILTIHGPPGHGPHGRSPGSAVVVRWKPIHWILCAPRRRRRLGRRKPLGSFAELS